MDDGTLTSPRRSWRIGGRSLALATVVAIVAVLVFRRALESPKIGQIGTRPVVIALRDIAEGQTIERASVAIARWPAGIVPYGSYSVPDSVVGRVARIGFSKGEVLMPQRLAASPAK